KPLSPTSKTSNFKPQTSNLKSFSRGPVGPPGRIALPRLQPAISYFRSQPCHHGPSESSPLRIPLPVVSIRSHLKARFRSILLQTYPLQLPKPWENPRKSMIFSPDESVEKTEMPINNRLPNQKNSRDFSRLCQ